MREPLYSVIASRAETRIRSGEWAPGTRLPPERDLCQKLDVSRATLRQALSELEERGLITRHQGRGTFVTHPRVQTPLSGFFSIREALAARGTQVQTRVVTHEVVEASRQIATDLACLPGDPLLHVERLRLADGEPIVLESAHLPLDRFPGLDRADFAGRSLYDILREDHGRSVAEAQETIEPVILTPRESGLLAVPRHLPAILTRRITTDRDGIVVELAQALLRGDRSRFLLIRHVAEPAVDTNGVPAADGARVQPGPDAAPPRLDAAPPRLDAPTVAGQLVDTDHARRRASPVTTPRRTSP